LRREASVGHMGPMLHQRSDQYPAELLEEQPPPVPRLKHLSSCGTSRSGREGAGRGERSLVHGGEAQERRRQLEFVFAHSAHQGQLHLVRGTGTLAVSTSPAHCCSTPSPLPRAPGAPPQALHLLLDLSRDSGACLTLRS
ncbi:hypothetical protein XENOCAPTIV_007687, partial [Xenoophorus captivus]